MPEASRHNAVLPYGRQTIAEEDIAAVVAVLRSPWLTTGPMVERFERAVADYVGAGAAVAVNSGTAALHAMAAALKLGPGDEVVVPALTFAATANAVVYQGATPVFADVDPRTLLLDPDAAESCISSRTRAIMAVDYAGQPCDYAALRRIAQRRGLALLADGCHSLGARLGESRVGTLADATAFSFHPLKPITTGEGGTVVTDQPELAQSMRRFRNHGIGRDWRQREQSGTWQYAMVDLGYNYRLSDIHCALGLAQLQRLDGWIARRQAIAARYDAALTGLAGVRPLGLRDGVSHGYHLYVVRIEAEIAGVNRDALLAGLRSRGIGANVHYLPVYLHPFYQQQFGTRRGMCPRAEAAYEEIVSLPVFPAMTDADVDAVVAAVRDIVATCERGSPRCGVTPLLDAPAVSPSVSLSGTQS